jgi:hypothetical protein
MGKRNYENLVEAEVIMEELEDFSRNVQKFNFRAILDPKNHERREQRMKERSE